MGNVNSLQGSSVATSSNGNTVAIGAPGFDDDGNTDQTGAVWVFTRSGDSWTQQGGKLIGSPLVGTQQNQGASVALSADGNTLAIGGPIDNTNIGATWIYTRDATDAWNQQAKLIGSDVIGTVSDQGRSVALSADGNTLAVGGSRDNETGSGISIGATWIFVRNGTTWTQQDKLIGTDGDASQQGFSVTLSSDGNSLVVGGPSDRNNINNSAGAIWRFIREKDSWKQQGEKIPGTEEGEDSGSFGRSVDTSADGNSLAVGYTFGINNTIGSTKIYN